MRTGPDYIQFYPTMRCNKACDFCFNRSMPAVPDMSLDSFRAMLETLGGSSVKTIDMIGGEPTMHADIIAIVREATKSGFLVNLSSNGSRPELLAQIMKLGKAVTVGISINDRQTLEQLRDFIKQHRPVVKTVYSPGMSRNMIDDILSLGPKRFYLIYRDALDRQELAEAVPFHQFLTAVEQRFTPLQVGMVYCSGFLADTEQYPELGRVRCPAGTTKLGVMPDGSVYPCNLFFGRKEFLLGNILTDSFASVWGHHRLAFFRSRSDNPCPRQLCTLQKECHGGCPAHSLFITGDISASDPRCSITVSPQSLL